MSRKPSRSHVNQQISTGQQSPIPVSPDPAFGNEGSSQRASIISASQQISYSGPLPPARELQAYEAACPGLARQIADMAIREQTHRHELEKKEHQADIENVRQMISSENAQKTRGQYLAFGVVLLITIVSAIGFYLGHPVVAAWLEGSTLLSLVALFLGNKIHAQSDVEKDRNSEE